MAVAVVVTVVVVVYMTVWMTAPPEGEEDTVTGGLLGVGVGVGVRRCVGVVDGATLNSLGHISSPTPDVQFLSATETKLHITTAHFTCVHTG